MIVTRDHGLVDVSRVGDGLAETVASEGHDGLGLTFDESHKVRTCFEEDLEGEGKEVKKREMTRYLTHCSRLVLVKICQVTDTCVDYAPGLGPAGTQYLATAPQAKDGTCRHVGVMTGRSSPFSSPSAS